MTSAKWRPATSNRDTEATWAYHNGTKHSWSSLRQNAHALDWSNKPIPFKVYTDLEPLPLPRQLSASGVPTISAISSLGAGSGTRQVPDLNTLAHIFYSSAGVTKKISHHGTEFYFRAAACTGALYHIELYLICGDLPGLEAGVYQFAAHDFTLRRLRGGDYRQVLVEASGRQSGVLHAPATIVCTSTFWRNSWKYQARAYRHSYWDSGTLLANLLAVAGDMPAETVLGFADQPVNQLLGLDTEKEVALALVPLGHDDPPPGPAPAPTPLTLETRPLSGLELDYPAIRSMHEASSLAGGAEAESWRRPPQADAPATAMPEPSGRLFPLKPFAPEELPQEPIEQVIVRRGSTRRFAQDAITFQQLSTALVSATRGAHADFLQPPGAMLNDLYLIVNNVDDLPQGAYVFHRDREALEMLMQGDFRSQAGYLGLEQELPADASVDIFLLANLEPVLQRYGNRGYRAAQLEAAIMGGKLYLAAYAQSFGASGLTFYDDEVTDFFSPHAAGKSVMFLVALGHSVRRKPDS